MEGFVEDTRFKPCLGNWQDCSYMRNISKAFKVKGKTIYADTDDEKYTKHWRDKD